MESTDEVNKINPPPDQNGHRVGKSDDNCLHNANGGEDSSSPSHKSHKSEGAATKPPPNQEMERSASEYRIPASVFERSKSSTPADWSAASNESLFSIHMGNLSFAATDWRQDDLGTPTAAPPRSSTSELFSYAAPANTAPGGGAEMRSHELGLAEATMLEVIKENEGQSPAKPAVEIRTAHRSAGSNQSNMSFAFSVAGGDAERTASSKPSLTAAPSGKTEAQPDQDSNPAAKENGAQTQSKWFFCFPCCSFCP